MIQVKDPLEFNLPSLGIVPIQDTESGKTQWVNTSGSLFKKKFKDKKAVSSEELKDLCKRNQADYVLIDTQEDFIPKLIKLFTIRNLTTKKA